MKKALKWLKSIYLAPFFCLMGVAGEDGSGETATDKETEANRLAAETQKAEAIARGDILETKEDDIDPDVLALIAGEDDGKKEEDDDKDAKFVPKGRFNEVNNEKKAVLEENERLKKELEEARVKKEPTAEEKAEVERLAAEAEAENPTTVVGMESKRDALQEKADELLVENGPHDDERKGIMKEINGLNKEIAKAELRAENNIVQTQASLKQELAAVTTDSLALYPFLDVNSEKCDEDAVIAVRDMRFRLEREGKPPAEALRLAVEEKGPKFSKMLGFTVDTKKADEIKAARDKAALKKAADTTTRQPAMLPAKGDKETFEIKVENLTQKQYDNLPEAEKAKLRGDVL